MAKKQEINLNEIDTNFVISSFKNKERRNNPSSIPRALVPEHEKAAEEDTEKPEATETPISQQNVTPREETKRKRSKSPDYESLFLINADISTRNGKLVSIREKYHDRITKIIQVIAKNEVSIFSYIDNVLQHHFEVFQDEISELYHKYYDEDDYLTPKIKVMKNILIVKVYVAVILLYTLFVVFSLFRFKQAKRRKKEVIGKGSIVNSKGNKTDIIGKSKFRNTHIAPSITIPEPLTSISSENEKRMEKPDTFAPSNETKVSAEVPEEELDALFSDTPPPNEENLPLNIDFPLEYESDHTNEEEDEYETEELEGLAGAALASGVRFEDLGNVVWTVSQKGKANATQKKLAGNTLLEIRQTDMFEQLISGKPDTKEIVTLLMEQSLAAFHRRTEHKSNNADSFDKVPDSFDIRDFA